MRMPWNFRNSAKEAVKTKGSSDDEQTDSGPRAAGHSQVGPSAKTEIKETISRSYGNEENATTQNAAKKVRGLSGALAKLVRIPRQIQQASFAQFKARRPEPVTAAQKACVASPQAAIPPKFGKSSLVAVHSWLQQADVTPEAITPLNFGDLIAPDYKPGPRNASPDFLYSRRASDSANLFGFTQWEKGGATASSGSMSSSSSTESLTNGWKEPARSTENRPVTFLDPELVGNNGSNIPCVAHSAVSVEIQGVRHYVHANRIHTQDSNPAIGEHVEKGVYVAGQSPSKVDALRLLLTHAIDSRQGIFQIIKSDDHAATMAGKSSKSLLAKLSRIRAGEILGERYEVESLERAYQDDVHACYLLRVRSTTGTSEAITIPLTQVGLKFDEKLLRTREINDAHRFLEEHVTFNKTLNEPTTSEPVVISQAGIGRSATVIVYNALIKKIESGDIQSNNDLDRALEEQIAIGRQDRGPQFIHSDTQRRELRVALRDKLPSPSATSTLESSDSFQFGTEVPRTVTGKFGNTAHSEITPL